MESNYFKNKVYLITGGSYGVGRATAERLLSYGAKVAVCARNSAGLEELANSVLSSNLLIARADIRYLDDIENFYSVAKARFGEIDGVVNNAGMAVVGTLINSSMEEVLEHLQTKIIGYLKLTQLFARDIRGQKSGAVVNIAGAAGVDPTPLLGIAGIVNAAVRNLSRMLADELAEAKIRVNVINPGTLQTRIGDKVVELFAQHMGVAPELVKDEMFGSIPLGRIPTPSDITESILFFLSDRSEMITGAELTPDGGTLIRRLRS